MTKDEARPIIAMLAGYWPTPQMGPEEVTAWAGELCGPVRIRPDEAQRVITDAAHHGSEFRLRPGQMIDGVQALRRRRVIDRNSRALIEAVPEPTDPDVMRRTLAQCRGAIAAAQVAHHVRRVKAATSAKQQTSGDR